MIFESLLKTWLLLKKTIIFFSSPKLPTNANLLTTVDDRTNESNAPPKNIFFLEKNTYLSPKTNPLMLKQLCQKYPFLIDLFFGKIAKKNIFGRVLLQLIFVDCYKRRFFVILKKTKNNICLIFTVCNNIHFHTNYFFIKKSNYLGLTVLR